MNIIRIKNYLTFLLLLVSILLPGLGILRTVLAEPITVAVFYPDIREPYRSIFLNIINGIKNEIKAPIKEHILRENESLAELRAWLEKDRIEAVIALGTQGVMAAKELSPSLRIVIGAVLVSPDQKIGGFSGITLAPDPELLFARLKALAPKMKQVSVVYDPEHSGWVIERAQEAAEQHRLELNMLPAGNLRQAATLYREVLRKADESQAIWLPQDPTTVDDNIILPLILEESWKRNLVVFSSNPAHVKRGVLFSMYPDNVGMGRSLAAIALNKQADSGNNFSPIRPLRDLLIAVNLRTADHLGLKFSSQQRREFDLVLPSP